MIVEAGRGYERTVGRECDMVDLLLMANHALHRCSRDGRLPEVHSAVVACCDQAFNATSSGRRRIIPLLRLLSLAFHSFRDGALAFVVVVSGP